MKKDETTTQDELRPEYDLRALEVRKVGPERKHFGRSVVQLAPDVAEVFPDAESVNEALRFLIRVTKENSAVPSDTGGKV
ncbi:MAG: hypothetical protein F4X51_24795 [Gemmatimonadetes bacterium]|nr:hypothetical protein [Gemmatimonadota bacterium]